MIPDSVFAICRTPLQNPYNVLDFSSESAQANYFAGAAIKTYRDFTYIRQTDMINVPAVLEDVIEANYCYFTNPHYGNKIFYAYIRNMEYVSPHNTAIFIEIDAWQTYQFDIKINQCFVEREHVLKSNDAIGNHTLPEPVPSGRMTYTLAFNSKDYQDVGAVIGVKKDLNGKLMSPSGWNRAIFACGLYAVEHLNQITTLVKKLEEVESGNVLFVQPMDVKALPPHDPNTGICFAYMGDSAAEATFWTQCTYNIGISRPDNLDGYVPKNNKLLTYPYVYCTCTSGKGGGMDYPFEMFDAKDQAQFVIACECSNNPSDTSIPINFEGQPKNYDKKCVTDVYPTIPHQGDNTEYYNMAKSFQATGQEIQSKQFVVGVYNSMMGNVEAPTSKAGAVKAVTNIVTSGLSNLFSASILNEQLDLEKAKLNDEQKRNSYTYNGASSASMQFESNDFGFKYYVATITREYARIIDDYLTKYGYSRLRNKVPYTRSRANFNFVKTAGSAITGNVPTVYLIELNNAFNSGITIWHNPATMYNYDVDNN